MAIRKEIPIKCWSVAAFLLRRKGRAWQVLLLRRKGDRLDGMWCQVAGLIEPGETAWQAALREIAEETGLAPDRFYSADLCQHFYEAHRDRISMEPIFVGFIDSDQDVALDEEHSEYRWMTFEEAERRLPFAAQRRILRHIEQEFVRREPNEWLRIRPGEAAS